MESPQKKVKLDLRTEPTCKPCLPEMKKPFEDTFFMQFIFDQLRNYSRDPRHHQYSDIAKRFWILVKYYAGKQFFVRMAGARNQHQPCNWFNHLHYNLIIPELATVKNWFPKGSRGIIPYFKETLEDIVSKSSCKNACISVDGMKVLKHIDTLNSEFVGVVFP
ncbi:hypothetical protein FDP41_000756 [Naegleria fowleri]|uniref:Uncharacterized protein n=1 Tax=Naegleria fowleri TaxID=5763 RepID=A0A6A5C6D5_NAEFO|nr:uncharacterized protein FDP41_000756 [Naegleria fowleri]KAF0984857.1 hypothetical protein FDP41_000756 [Naegleria fowleri]